MTSSAATAASAGDADAAGDAGPGRPAADGLHTVNGTPRSATSLTPFVVVSPAADAIDFYVSVFGARLVDRTDLPGPDGTTSVAHAVLDLGQGLLQLGDPSPAYHLVARPDGDDDCYSLGLYRPDVDAVVERAVAAGATLREPVTDFVSGTATRVFATRSECAGRS